MALKSDVTITTIERDNEMFNLAINNIKLANCQDRIKVINEDALEVEEAKIGSFDLIFIDAAKAQSIKFFNK